jgi:protein-tyrosine phosphatase
VSRPTTKGPVPLRVCFVCTGNICRSPMAEVVLRSMAADVHLDDGSLLADHLVVDSAGTGNWHAGEPMDPRAAAALADGGYTDPGHRARAFETAWFDHLDLVVSLARNHQQTLVGLARRWAGGDDLRDRLVLLRSYDPRAGGASDVPDPYYGDDADFAACRTMVEAACRGLVTDLVARAADRSGQPAGGPNVTSDSAS